MYRIYLPQDWFKCKPFVNMVMNFGFHKMLECSLLGQELRLSAFHRLCLKDLVRCVAAFISLDGVNSRQNSLISYL
jgi:hypothetical protein